MKNSSYRPQLDGLRAVAVLGVVFQHFAPASWSTLIPWGGLGVTLFFILSGYLITGILLKGREQPESRPYFLSHFYVRRALRIFPIYYATLAVAALLAIPPVRETFWWHAAYLSNVYFVLKNSYCGAVSPFWSLAVEQHFYLLWPWIVLFVPRKGLGTVFAGAILCGFGFRLMGYALHWNAITINLLTPAAFEPFGIGALLALRERNPRQARLAAPSALWFGLLFLPAALWFSHAKPGSAMQMIFGSLAWGPIFFYLIAGAARGFGGWGGRALGSHMVTYIGQISYGIYLMHNLVTSKIPMQWNIFPGARGLIAFAATLILSAASYHYLETPIREIKRFFPYTKPAPRDFIGRPRAVHESSRRDLEIA